MIDRFPDASDLERAEWFRFLTRLMRNGAERFMENCEPFRPRAQITGWRTSINVQMPDQDHYLTEWDEPVDMRYFGNRNTTPYFVLAAWSAKQPEDLGARSWAPLGFAGVPSSTRRSLQTGAFLSSDDVHFDAEGNFSILLSQNPPADGGDWLQLEPDSVGLLLRVVHHRREEEIAPTVQVERLDGAAPQSVDCSAGQRGLGEDGSVAVELQRAGAVVVARQLLASAEPAAVLAQDVSEQRRGPRPALRVRGVAVRRGRGTGGRVHGAGVRAVDPAAVQHLAREPRQLRGWAGLPQQVRSGARSRRRVRLVVSATDPGVSPNRVDPYGHVRGIMGCGSSRPWSRQW